MKQAQKTAALWIFMLILLIFLYQTYENRHQTNIQDFNYSKFSEAVKASEIASVSFKPDSNEIIGEVKPEFEKKYSGKHFQIVGNTTDEGFKFLVANGLTPNYEHSENNSLMMLN